MSEQLYKFFGKGYALTEAKLVESTRAKKAGDTIWCREGSVDEGTVKQVYSEYRTTNCKDLVVLDLGGNIGAFSVRALGEGATKVICVEPDEHNFPMVLKNAELHGDKFISVNAAAISSDEPDITFYISRSTSSVAGGTINKSKGKMCITVPAVNFYNLLEEHKPDFIKMDIEGGEFNILPWGYKFPDYVKEIACELHGYNGSLRIPMFKLLKELHEQFPFTIGYNLAVQFKEDRLIHLHFSRRLNEIRHLGNPKANDNVKEHLEFYKDQIETGILTSKNRVLEILNVNNKKQHKLYEL